MNGVEGLADAIKTGLKVNRQSTEQQAVRAVIRNGKVCIGARCYPFTTAVDCNTDDGGLVWVLLTKSGTAVVVGG